MNKETNWNSADNNLLVLDIHVFFFFLLVFDVWILVEWIGNIYVFAMSKFKGNYALNRDTR